MKLTVLQQDILPAIQAVSRSVGVRSTLPVLSNILFSTDGSRLKIAATNLEIGIIKYIQVEVADPGEITVPAKTLVEIISGLGVSKIEIETVGDIMNITSGSFKAIVNGIGAAEFPVIPLNEGEGIKFKKQVLEGTSSILFAAAVDEGRPILTGILTEAKDKNLNLVATDGFRLAYRRIQLPDDNSSIKCLIPKRTLEEVLRVIQEEGVEEVGIYTSSSQNQVVFTVGNTTLSSRLIEGQFPAWEKIIPTEIKSRALVDKEALLKAIKLASVFARTEANVITLKVGENKISFESEAKELGSQHNEVESQIEGEEIQIAFSAKFLQDAISAAPATQLMIEFSGPLSPALVKPMGVEGLEYIIMPVRTS